MRNSTDQNRIRARLDEARTDLRRALHGTDGTGSSEAAARRVERVARELEASERVAEKLGHRRAATACLNVAGRAAERMRVAEAEAAGIPAPVAAPGLVGRVVAFRDRRRRAAALSARAEARDDLAEALRMAAHEIDLGLDDMRPVFWLSQNSRGASSLSSDLRSASRKLERACRDLPVNGLVDLRIARGEWDGTLRSVLEHLRGRIDHHLEFGSFVRGGRYGNRDWQAPALAREGMVAASRATLAVPDMCPAADVADLAARLAAAADSAREVGTGFHAASWRRRIVEAARMDGDDGIDPELLAELATAAGIRVEPEVPSEPEAENVPGRMQP